MRSQVVFEPSVAAARLLNQIACRCENHPFRYTRQSTAHTRGISLQKPLAKLQKCGIRICMVLGYARVSTGGQDEALQVEALKAAGVEKLYVEKASGSRWDRPELQRMLESLRKGDVVMVWKLDRLSRSLRDLLTLLSLLEDRGAGFRSLTESVDTTTPAGRMFAEILGSFAAFERNMLRERTMAGLKTARKEGRIGGRPPKLSKVQRAEALKMLKGGKSQADVSRVFNVSASTICRLSA